MTEKKTPSRIYIVEDKSTQSPRVCVRAHNPAQAINYATRDRFSIRVAGIEDYVQKAEVIDATVPGVHPDQQPLEGV